MKRYGYIYEKVYTRENIKNAIIRAAHGKQKRGDVRRVLNNEEDCIDEIQYLLITQTYKPSPYRQKVVWEGSRKKERHILIPKFFPDQVIQWAVLLQIIPALSRGMDAHVCGSVPGRGKDEAKRYIERWLRTDPKGTKYCLQLDTHHFYPSVNHGCLKAMLCRVFKDQKLLRLLGLIIDSAPGLPVGNVTSQWFANFYFQGLDHYIKEHLHVFQSTLPHRERLRLAAERSATLKNSTRCSRLKWLYSSRFFCDSGTRPDSMFLRRTGRL